MGNFSNVGNSAKKHERHFVTVTFEKKRSDHDCSLDEWHVAIACHQRSMPNRACRVAQRTRLAKGAVETTADMPIVSMGQVGRKHQRRKPFVSSVLKHAQVPSCCEPEFDFQAEHVGTLECESTPQAPMGWMVTYTRSSKRFGPLRTRSKKHSVMEPELYSTCTSDSNASTETTVGELTTGELSNSGDDSTAGLISSDVFHSGESHAHVANTTEPSHPNLLEKREMILRSIIDKLREQNQEAEQAVVFARARAQEAEAATLAQQATAAKSKKEAEKLGETIYCSETSMFLKQAKELDQQRAKKQQRRAVAERRLHEVKQKVLDEARLQAAEDCRCIKEHAMREVASLKAQARAEVHTMKTKARSAVKAKVRDCSLMLCAHADAAQGAKTSAKEIPAMKSQVAKTEPAPEVATVPLTVNELTTAAVGSNLSVETVVLEEDWEMLTSLSIEQNVDSSWDIVIV